MMNIYYELHKRKLKKKQLNINIIVIVTKIMFILHFCTINIKALSFDSSVSGFLDKLACQMTTETLFIICDDGMEKITWLSFNTEQSNAFHD